MKFFILIAILLVNCIGGASERLYMRVKDESGNPVPNAFVHVGVEPTTAFWGSGKGFGGGDYYAKTDASGAATVKFNCTQTEFTWSVYAEGYYRSDTVIEFFTSYDIVPVPPAFGKVILHEHEKRGEAVLFRKKNPQPMVAHGIGYEVDQHLFPMKDGIYGFDLMQFDWLPPLGKGEVADFYIVRRIGVAVPDGVVGYLQFPDNCGMYFGKQTGQKNFPSIYEADTNSVFHARKDFIFERDDAGKKGITYKDIVASDEYAVLRTRVACDENGNIVRANYSKILGPFRVGEAYKGVILYTPCSVFNPRVNDPNLESDVERAWNQGEVKRMLTP